MVLALTQVDLAPLRVDSALELALLAGLDFLLEEKAYSTLETASQELEHLELVQLEPEEDMVGLILLEPEQQELEEDTAGQVLQL